MRSSIVFILSAHVAITILFGLSACGGGTSGSGMTSYEGTVSETDGSGIKGVTLSVESTGDSTTTDTSGNFTLSSPASGPEVSFLAESEDFSTRFVVKNILDQSSRVRVHVTIDRAQATASARHHNVKAAIVGACASFFDNREYIRQIKRIPEGIECTAAVTLLSEGSPAQGAPIALQYASCKPNATWTTLTVSHTGTTTDIGVANLSFAFSNAADHCRYRIVAPLTSHHPSSVLYPINTIAEEDAEHDHTSGYQDSK